MGTNYYLVPPACDKCGRHDQAVHIGKSHITFECPIGVLEGLDMGPVSWAEWKLVIAHNTAEGWTIRDEYHETIDPAKFIADVEASDPENRRWQYEWMRRHSPDLVSPTPRAGMTWIDADGFTITARGFS